MPYLVAYRNRKEHPLQSRIIYWLWSILYVLLLPLCFIG